MDDEASRWCSIGLIIGIVLGALGMFCAVTPPIGYQRFCTDVAIDQMNLIDPEEDEGDSSGEPI